jgi:hypothetical protein
MTYTLAGLPREPFARSFEMSDDELVAAGARRVVADADRGYPCRIRLADAKAGESLIFLNYVSHDVPGPFRTAYAIYVGEQPGVPASFHDELPEQLADRALSLRAFGEDGLIVTGKLVGPHEADMAIRLLFADRRVAYIMAHFAAYGCLAARIERHGECVREAA